MAKELAGSMVGTLENLMAVVPEGWHGADLCVHDRVDGACRVQRVALHENEDGRRIVVIHSQELSACIYSTKLRT